MKATFAEHLIATGRVSRDRLDQLPRGDWHHREPIGRLAMMHGLLSGVDIEEILRYQNTDERLFGEIAVRRGILTTEQVEILFRGQSIRACVELVEDLALAGILDFNAGLQASLEFIAEQDLMANPVGQAVENTGVSSPVPTVEVKAEVPVAPA